MSFRFCFGPSGAGKSYRLKREITKRADAALLSDQHFLYIVPEQYTMQTQKDLVMASPAGGIMNVDVLSFGRLSHRIFEEVGADPRVVLDDVGKSLILQRVAGSLAPSLRVLGKRLHSPGMIAEVKSILSEFMQYDLAPEDIRRLSDYALSHGQNALALKLQDLQQLYLAFLDYKKDHFLTGEETLDLLAEAIPRSDLIRHSVLVFDGFTGFTPVQYRVLEALLANAQEVIFAITIGEDGGPSAAECEILPTRENQKKGLVPLLDPQDLFYLSRRTIRDICIHADRAGAAHTADENLCQDGSVPFRFRNNPALAHFEQHLFRYPQQRFHGRQDSIRIMAASTVEEEVRQVCIRIREMVRTEGYLYRDFGIIAGDLETYGEQIRRMAALYEIPVYVDRTRAVRQNPLTEAIGSALEIAGRDYSYATVFRYLRSGLSSVSRAAADRLENYVLAHGVNSRRKWSLPFDAENEAARQQLLSELEPLDAYRQPEEGGKDSGRETGATKGSRRRDRRTAKERTLSLYDFLVKVQAEDKMAACAEAAAAQQDPERQQEYEQIYGAVIHLLEQIYALLGDEPMTGEDYLELVQAGLEEIRLGTLPQKADRILVGDMERTRLAQIKVLFVVGVNDGNIPKNAAKGGLISDLDREFLDGSDIALSPTPREQMYLQRLYLYLNMTRQTQQLVLSYARMKPDGSSVRPSYFISWCQGLFPDLVVAVPEREEGLTRQLTGSADVVRFLSEGLRDYAAGISGSREEEFLAVYGWCTRPGAPASLRTQVFARREDAFLRYTPDRISQATANRLYGRVLSGSVSRFETAVQCYRKHFLAYGLRLAQRDAYQLEPADVGTVLHEGVQAFSEALGKAGLSWNDFTETQAAALVRQALVQVAENYRNHLLTDTSRSRAGVKRAEGILLRTVRTLQYQLRQGAFVPAAYEVSFGDSNEYRLALPDGGVVQLHGRIDRVDLCREDGRCWVKIIDYKTGNLDLDREQILQGLRLQLLLYMNVVLEAEQGRWPGTEAVPAALLYYRFQDPVLQTKDLSAEMLREVEEKLRRENAQDQQPSEAIRTGLLRQLRPHGMVNGDEEAIALLDHDFSGSSLVIPVGKTKKGTFTKSSRVFSKEEYEELSAAVRQIILNVAGEIRKGNIAAEPAILPGAGRTACTWCPYANVCGFDPKTPGYHYQTPDPLHRGGKESDLQRDRDKNPGCGS